jgi:hypothetical protein
LGTSCAGPRRKNLARLDAPAVKWGGPSRVIDTETRWEQARWLLHDDAVKPEDRLAGLLVLLYADAEIEALIERRRELRHSAELRTATGEEWAEFEQHFLLRKVALGDCHHPYGTPCKHEHPCFSELRVARVRADSMQSSARHDGE